MATNDPQATRTARASPDSLDLTSPATEPLAPERPRTPEPSRAPLDLFRTLDDRLIRLLRRNGIMLLRVVLGGVFFWFGALKLAGVSPAASLVAKTLPFLPAEPTVFAMGVVEVLIALGLLSGWAIRVTLFLFLFQMLGTLLPLITLPETVYEGGNPLRLSLLGEFVLKNFVLISAGLVVLSASPTAREEERGRDTVRRKPDRGTRSPDEDE